MLSSALLLGLASAAVAKHCQNITVPLTISARNGVFNMETPKTEIQVTNFILDLTAQGQNYTAKVITGYKTITGKYKLATTYCEPDKGRSDKLQILTHGIGFDRSYWDFPFNNYNYSYVNRAIDQGYSTLSWDRLGIGHSSHGDPIAEIQIFMEIAALKALTRWVKQGKLPGGKHKASKVVQVGHSFGSSIVLGLNNESPELSNAMILTGFGQVPNFVPEFALGGNFVSVKEAKGLADKYVEGYLAGQSTVGLHTNVFAPGGFDPRILTAAAMSGQPAAIGEFLTMGGVAPKTQFKGPVLIITGERDLPFCGGDCKNAKAINSNAPNLIEMSRENFKSASVFNAKVVPGAGHGINYHYSAPVAYKVMLDFLRSSLK
ncbi:hypothetical protein HIM_10233 [Hirsutella minnesotensis 3608]|uniref:AB hydrolase-1 domain-containing protein n=1 Tax=Hirsutella minnesotensis 3608 TaxID=1043627 RepID=A0A0F8A2I0_9HYPO|nr:hypothetical protein HIM_10233 [Hirsutella minnesotensis 3608]